MDYKPGGIHRVGDRFTCPVCSEVYQIAAEGPGMYWENVKQAEAEQQRTQEILRELAQKKGSNDAEASVPRSSHQDHGDPGSAG